jgi:hypothetical protein
MKIASALLSIVIAIAISSSDARGKNIFNKIGDKIGDGIREGWKRINKVSCPIGDTG